METVESAATGEGSINAIPVIPTSAIAARKPLVAALPLVLHARFMMVSSAVPVPIAVG